MPINFTLYHSFNRFLKQPQENHNKAKTDWEYFGGTNISLSKWFQSRHLARFDYLARPEDLCSANISKVNIWQISRFSKLRGRQSLPNMPSFNKFGKLAQNWQHYSYVDCQNVTLPARPNLLLVNQRCNPRPDWQHWRILLAKMFHYSCKLQQERGDIMPI